VQNRFVVDLLNLGKTGTNVKQRSLAEPQASEDRMAAKGYHFYGRQIK
jgi:hypothetical protein